jgi:hypothetical protein
MGEARIVEVNEPGCIPFFGVLDKHGEAIATTEHLDVAQRILRSVINEDAFYRRLQARADRGMMAARS